MKKLKRVALIGLDGSGKSANVNLMKADDEFNEFNFVWVRWKPIILGPAYWFLKKLVNKNTVNKVAENDFQYGQKNTIEQKQLSAHYSNKLRMKGKIFKHPIICRTWMLMALIDYFLQFYAKTFGLILGKKNIVFDRSYLDLFVDQGINFGYTPEKIEREIKKYEWLFPKINQTIYIKVDPKTCYKRKDDIPNIDYLYKRYYIYEKLSQNLQWTMVDGENSIEKVQYKIKSLIL